MDNKHIELERRFEGTDIDKLYSIENIIDKNENVIYRQNYIYFNDEKEIEDRIRLIIPFDILENGCQYKRATKFGKGRRRIEIKKNIPGEEFIKINDFLCNEMEYKPISKIHSNYRFFYRGREYTLELSRFIDPKGQKNIVEIEFDNEEEMNFFVPPSYFGREITNEYSNIDIWKKYNNIK